MTYEVILDTGETANKCTIAPLSYRTDFQIIHVKGNKKFGPLKSPILLHPEGKCITTIQISSSQIQGIATVDCVWRRLEGLIRRIDGQVPIWVKIPEGFETAYPRRSKRNSDPEHGLATIEAIFVAAALLGNWDSSLLSEYYFGLNFIELNRRRFLDLGVSQAADPGAMPVLSPRIQKIIQNRRRST